MTRAVKHMISMVVGAVGLLSAVDEPRIGLYSVADETTTMISSSNFSYARFINKPGNYLVTEPISFSEYEPAIVIDCDNVTLDFGGNALIAPIGLEQTGDRQHVGVRIEKFRTGVSVLNGAVKNFQDNGIDMSENANVTLQNMTIVNSNYGLYVDTVTNLTAMSLSIINSHINGVYATSMVSSTLTSVALSTIGNAFYALDNYVGFNLNLTTQSTLNMCSVIGMQAQASLYGFSLVNGANCILSGCISSGNQAPLCVGFYATGGNHNQYVSVEANRNSGTSDPSSEVDGCYFDENESYFQLLSSSFSHNSSPGGSVYGIKIGSATTTIFPFQGIIRGNELSLNNGAIKQYGIKDFANPTTNAFFTNKAFGHGRTFVSGSTMKDTGKMNYCMYIGSNPHNLLNNIVKESSYGDQTISVDDLAIKNSSFYL